mgnify:CR=1 FL=1
MNRSLQTIIYKLSMVLFLSPLLFSCEETLIPQDQPQAPGSVFISAYVQTDSIRIMANGDNLIIDDQEIFSNRITKDYKYVYYNHQSETIEIINNETQDIMRKYEFTEENSADTLSFFYKPGIWIEDVLSSKPGTLNQSGYTGYRFIFPNMNRYSNSGYEGPLDGIISKITGQQLGIVENIDKETFSTFLEFPYTMPPIIKMRLVKHGTTESYISGQTIEVQMVMQNNKSCLIVLEETVDSNGNFSGVNGTIDLTNYFDY